MKLLGLAVVVAALVGTGGVGYAWCGGGGGGGCNGPQGLLGGHDCGSEVGLQWTNPSGEVTSPRTACALTLTPSTLYVAVSGLAPGQGCTFHADLKNTGTKSLWVTEDVRISEPSSCARFAYSDNLPSAPPPKIDPGHVIAYSGSVSLSPAAGNACQGLGASFSIVLTGSTESRCDQWDELAPAAASSLPLWDCD